MYRRRATARLGVRHDARHALRIGMINDVVVTRSAEVEAATRMTAGVRRKPTEVETTVNSGDRAMVMLIRKLADSYGAVPHMSVLFDGSPLGPDHDDKIL